MRNTMSTNSAMMRAMTTPMQAPSRLAMRKIMPTKGLKAMRGERRDRAGKAEQDGNHNSEPIEDFDHSGRHEPLPLEQVADAEHRGFSRRKIGDTTTALEFTLLEKLPPRVTVHPPSRRSIEGLYAPRVPKRTEFQRRPTRGAAGGNFAASELNSGLLAASRRPFSHAQERTTEQRVGFVARIRGFQK